MKRNITNSTHKRKSPSFLKARGIEVLESRIAPASLAILSGGGITVLGDQGGAGEVETLIFSISGGNLHISDPTHGITGAGGFSSGGGNDIFVSLSSFTGNLAVDTGIGADTLTFSSALSLPGHASLTSGLIVFNNSLALAADKNIGVNASGTIDFPNSSAHLAASGTGTISLTTARDIKLASGSSVTTVDGDLTLSANQQTTASTGSFIGVDVNGGLVQTTGSGVLSVTGKGSNGSATGQTGVLVQAGGGIIGGTTGTMTVAGTGGPSAANFTTGVTVTDAGSAISTGGAHLVLVGNSLGVGSSAQGYGVNVQGGGVVSSGAGGSVTVFGNGGGGSGANQHGVVVQQTGSAITSGGGNVQITGAEGSGASSVGIFNLSSGVITTATNGGTITLVANSMNITAGISAQGTSVVTFLPRTSGVAINVGTGADPIGGPLGLSGSEMGFVTAGTVQIGNANSGAITVSSAITFSNHLSLTTGAGVTFNNAVTMAANKNLTVSALGTSDGTINLANANADLAASGTGAISLTTVRDITLATGSSLTVVGGGLTLSANQQTTATTGNFVGINVAGAITSTGVGGVLVQGRGGDSSSNYGINVNAGTITGGTTGSSVMVQGTGGTGAVANQRGVTVTGVTGAITSNSGSVIVNGQGGGGGAGTFSYGVDVRLSSSITAGGGGTVTINGTGGSGSGAIHLGVHVLTGGQITSGGGNVNVTGTGGAGGGAGVDVNGGTITAGSGAFLNIVGIGTGGGAASHGVFLTNAAGSTITSGGGIITITGTASAGAGASDLTAQSGATIGGGNMLVINADSISLDTSGTPATVNAGTNSALIQQRTNGTLIDLGGADSVGTLGLTDAELDQVTAGTLQIGNANSGAITVSAAITHGNNLSLTTGAGVTFNSAVTMAANKNLTVSALGTSDGTINFATANADLSASGTGVISLTTVKNIVFASGASVTTVNGNLTLSANAAGTNTGTFDAIDINAGTIQATGSGNVTITGTGGSGGGADPAGVVVRGGGAIIGGTSGTVTVTGTGGTGTSDDGGTFNLLGVSVEGTNSTITSSGANVQVTGIGGTSSGSGAGGVLLINSAMISAGGNGTVTVTGTGGSGTYFNYGIDVVLGSTVTSNNGAVQVTGTGGTSAGGSNNNNWGVIAAIGGKISAGGTDSVTVTGTGGSGTGGGNHGVVVRVVSGTAGQITSSGGDVTIAGTAGTGGSGNLGVEVQSGGAITTATSGGNITVIADKMSIADAVSATNSSIVTLRQKTNTVAIDLGSTTDAAANTLELSDAELDLVTAGTLQIGNANSGMITVSAAITYAGSLSLTNGGGTGITVANPITLGLDKNLTVSSLGGTLTVGANLSVSGVGVGMGGITLNGVNITGSGAIAFGFEGLTLNNTANAGNASALSGIISGLGNLTKNGVGTIALSGNNTYTGITIVMDGTLQISKDINLGNLANTLSCRGGDLAVTNGFITTRHFNRTADTNIDIAAGILRLNGTVDGAGLITQSGAGTLIIGGDFLGERMITPTSGPVIVGTSKVALTGSGSAVVTVVSDGMGGKKIELIELSNTTTTTAIIIKGPTTIGGTIVVERITSTDPVPEIASISLNKGVILGDGVNDAIPDIDIAGKIGRINLQSVADHAIIRLGTGLSYNNIADDTSPDTYNNKPDLFIRGTVGEGVVVDVTGDGMPSGTGGGGLGRVVVNSWPGSGTIKTTQSIKSFKLKTGDCNVVFEVDKNHIGSMTTASIGSMLIAAGSWGSSGSEIEGEIGTFSAVSFLAAANISAGNIAKLIVKSGPYMGTTTLTDPSAAGLGTVTVNGNFTGSVNSVSSIINVKVKGDFTGSLSAKSIGSITAYTFDGTTVLDNFGDPLKKNIIAYNGSLGLIKSTAGGIRNYEIVAATVFAGLSATNAAPADNIIGLENLDVEAQKINGLTVALKAGVSVMGIVNSTFETSSASIGAITSSHSISGSTIAAATNIGKITIGGAIDPTAGVSTSLILGGTYLGGDGTFNGNEVFTRAATIGAIAISGTLSSTTIAAGINPVNGIFGDNDDIASLGVAPVLAIGAVSIGAGSGTLTGTPLLAHSYGIEAVKIKSIKVGAAAAVTTLATSHYIKFGGAEAIADILVKQI